MGTLHRVTLYCINGHMVLDWRSQPMVGSIPAANLMVSAALLFSGNTFSKLKLNVYFFWQVSGDGRCDSPGCNAKYCTYTMIDMATQKIVWSELVQVSETTSSVEMEKLGFKRSVIPDVLMKKRLLKDIHKLTKACQTGSLEVFHGALLKYCTKRQEFDFPNMMARLQLAIIDHNRNCDRPEATTNKPVHVEKKLRSYLSSLGKCYFLENVNIVCFADAKKTKERKHNEVHLPRHIAEVPSPTSKLVVSSALFLLSISGQFNF
ncbi:uncharacterized protein [Apostichopus japonicus]|uniref:uncharacterized protein n=1 Tax=Stichopus japonicus TaxID=307972 RepID=UPI003AB6CD48